MARFQAGKSGNPGGRPKGAYSERCREWADARGLDFLTRVAEGREPGFQNKHALRIEAAKYLTDRGYGRPSQRSEVSCKGATLEDFLGGTYEKSAERK